MIIEYDRFSVSGIKQQIADYEKKYGMGYAAFERRYFERRYHDDDASDEEHDDRWDWMCLVEELKDRKKKARKKRVISLS